MSLMTATQVSTCYGEFQALKSVSVEIADASSIAIVGPNGAGKSTLLKTLAGWLPSRSGEIEFDGGPLRASSAADLVRQGIALVPEGRRLFPSLSIEENLLMGCNSGRKGPWNLARIYDIFPILKERRRSPATALSGGQQQMVAIGRSLMTNPRLLLCDELSLGLAPIVVGEIYAMLPKIRAEGVTLVIVEQDVHRALASSTYAYCLLEGQIALEGPSASLSHEAITGAYFGAHK